MTRRSLPHIRARLAQPLAILPAKLEEIDAVLAGPVQIQGAPPQRARSYYMSGNVAVVPIGGTLVKSAGGIMAASGLTSYAQIAEGLRGALADNAAAQILLHIDSPGGEVDGLLGVADQVFAARGQKPITALVDSLAASAAYIIASQADRIVLTDALAEVGSIGVIAQHVDRAGADAQEGLIYTTMFIGKRKADFDTHQPLSQEAKARAMATLQNAFDEIVTRVARGRSISANAIKSTEAATYQGEAAIGAGLADSIQAPDALLADLNASTSKRNATMTLRNLNPQPQAGGTVPPTDPDAVATIADIRALAKTARLSPEATLELIDVGAGQPLAVVRDAIQRHKTTMDAATQISNRVFGGRPLGNDTYDNPEFLADAAASALLHRFTPGAALPDNAKPFAGMTLSDMAGDMLRRNGVSTIGKTPARMIQAALHSTSDFPQLLGDFANKALRRAYEAAPSGLKMLARESTAADFKNLHRLAAGEFPTLEKVNEHGEFKSGTMGEAGETYRLFTYGKIIGLTRQAMVNDDLSALNDMTRRIGLAVAEFEASQFAALINSNPEMADTETVFSVAHANLASGGAAISDGTLSTARKAMRDQKGVDDQVYINPAPKFILVNSGRETEAEKAVATITAAVTDEANVFTRLIPVVDPRVTGGANGGAWYLVGDPNVIDGIEYAYLQDQRGPRIETEVGFDYDGTRFKVALDFGAGWLDWRGWFKNPGN